MEVRRSYRHSLGMSQLAATAAIVAIAIAPVLLHRAAANKAIANKAIANKAVAEKAAADKLAADKAAADKATAEKAAADKAVADKAAADKAVADKAADNKAAADTDLADKAAADKAVADKAAANKAAADGQAHHLQRTGMLVTHSPYAKGVHGSAGDARTADMELREAARKAAADKAVADKAVADKAAADKAAYDKAATDKAAADKAAVDKAAADKAAADKAAADKAAADKAAADKAAADKAAADKGAVISVRRHDPHAFICIKDDLSVGGPAPPPPLQQAPPPPTHTGSEAAVELPHAHSATRVGRSGPPQISIPRPDRPLEGPQARCARLNAHADEDARQSRGPNPPLPAARPSPAAWPPPTTAPPNIFGFPPCFEKTPFFGDGYFRDCTSAPPPPAPPAPALLSDDVFVTIIDEAPPVYVKESDAIDVGGGLFDKPPSPPQPQPTLTAPESKGLKGGSKYQCGICLMEFKSKYLLEQHTASSDHVAAQRVWDMPAMASDVSPNFCALCDRHIDSTSQLMQHCDSKKHKALVAVRERAPKRAREPSPQHAPHVAPDLGPFRCDVCVLDFESSHVLASHTASSDHVAAQRVWDMPAMASDATSTFCVLCNRRFENMSQLMQHCESKKHKELDAIHARAPKRVREPSPSPQHPPPQAMMILAAQPAARGVRNIGNSCYLSGVFQLMVSCPAIVAIIRDKLLSLGLTEDDRQCCELISRLAMPRDVVSAVDPSPLMSVGSVEARFRQRSAAGFQQHDAHEFLLYVLSRLGPNVTEEISFTMETSSRCQSCRHESSLPVTAEVITLHFPPGEVSSSVPLSRLWRNALVPETLSGEANASLCEQCMDVQPRTNCLRVVSFPNNIVFHIQRSVSAFTLQHGGSTRKIFTAVDIPSVFHPEGSPHPYYLRAVVRHIGLSVQSGHYVAERLFGSTWFSCNDSTVVPKHGALPGDVYLVMYSAEPPPPEAPVQIGPPSDRPPPPPQIPRQKALPAAPRIPPAQPPTRTVPKLAPIKKAPPVGTKCELCNVCCTTTAAMAKHVKSKGHQNRVEEAKTKKRSLLAKAFEKKTQQQLEVDRTTKEELSRLGRGESPSESCISLIAEKFCHRSLCLVSYKETDTKIADQLRRTCVDMIQISLPIGTLFSLVTIRKKLERVTVIGPAGGEDGEYLQSVLRSVQLLLFATKTPTQEFIDVPGMSVVGLITAMLCQDAGLSLPKNMVSDDLGVFRWLEPALNGKDVHLPLVLFPPEEHLRLSLRRKHYATDAVSMDSVCAMFSSITSLRHLRILPSIVGLGALSTIKPIMAGQHEPAAIPLLLDDGWHLLVLDVSKVQVVSPCVRDVEAVAAALQELTDDHSVLLSFLEYATTPHSCDTGVLTLLALAQILCQSSPLLGAQDDGAITKIRHWVAACADARCLLVPTLGDNNEFVDIERNPDDARRTFYDQSKPRARNLRECTLKPETANKVLSGYHAAMRDDREVSFCGICGIRGIGEPQRSLTLTQAQRELLACSEGVDRGCGLKLCLMDDVMLHLDPLCVLPSREVLSCPRCIGKLNAGQVPTSSYKNLDLGMPPDTLPSLSVCEKVLLSQVVVHRTVIKVMLRGGAFQASVTHQGQGKQGAFKGHVISFRRDPEFLKAFLDVDQAASHITVMILGKRVGDSERKRAHERLSSMFRVNAEVLQQWVTWLAHHNEAYAHLKNFVVDPKEMERFRSLMHEQAVVPHESIALQGIVADAFATSNVADGAAESPETFHSVFVTEREVPPSRDCANQVLHALKARLGKEPANEYTDMKSIMLGGFPWLFVRWPSDTNFLNDEKMRTLMLRRGSVCATDAPLLFFFYDVKVRREVCQNTAAAVRTKKEYMASISAFLNSDNLEETIDKAIANPKCHAARKIEADVLGYIQMCTKSINFSPGKRRACRGPLYAMYRRFGLPSFWITLSPSDNDNVMALRLSVPGSDGPFAEFKLPSLKERARIISKNPILTAELFDHIVKSVCKHIFGLEDVHGSFTSNTVGESAAFGEGRAHFGVVECQKRGCLHFHVVLFTHLSPHIVSEMVADPCANEDIARCIDSFISAQLDDVGQRELSTRFRKRSPTREQVTRPKETASEPRLEVVHEPVVTAVDADDDAIHVAGLTPDEEDETAVGDYRSATHPIPQIIDEYFNTHVSRTAVEVQTHVIHRAGCFDGSYKGSKEDKLCRFAMKALVYQGKPGIYAVGEERDETGVAIEKNGRPVLRILEELPELPEAPENFPFPSADDRPLVWLTKTDQDPTQVLKVGSVVVPFSPVLTACVRCNTCVVFMLTQSAATAIYFYLLKYMTKEINPLAGMLPLLKEAKADATRYPSTVKDSDAHGDVGEGDTLRRMELRPAQHVLIKLCNKIHRKMEVSAQMAAATILGNESEYASHTFNFINVSQGQANLTRRLLLRDGHGDSGDDDEINADDDSSACNSDTVVMPIQLVGAGEEKKRLEVVGAAHDNYRFRGTKLRQLDWYVYSAVITVLQRKDVKTGGKAGRKVNATFEFDPEHPDFTTHIQRLKTRHTVPVIIGNVPVLPKFLVNREVFDGKVRASGSLNSKMSKFARFMVTLFSPWGNDGFPLHSMSWTGFCKLVSDVEASDPGKYFVMRNFGNDLHGATENQQLAQSFRKQCADTFKEANLAGILAKEYGYEAVQVQHELEHQIGQQMEAVPEGSTMEAANDYAENLASIYDALIGADDDADVVPEAGPPTSNPTEIMCGRDHVSACRQIYDEMKSGETEKKVGTRAVDAVAQALRHQTEFHGDPNRSGSERAQISFPHHNFRLKCGKVATLNAEQRAAVGVVASMLNGETRGPANEVPRSVLFLLGGAGTGKSGVIRFLTQQLDTLAMTMAPTGIAATVIDCTTIHAALSIPIGTKEDGDLDPGKVKALSSDVVLMLQPRFVGKRLLIIDEISMVSREILEIIDIRLRQILGQNEYMGGMILLAVGDFHQLKPSGGTPLTAISGPGKRILENTFKRAHIFELREQMRAPSDALFCEILDLMRTNPKEGMKKFLANVKVLTAADRSSFQKSLTIVCSNVERYHLNVAGIRRFAVAEKQVVYAWSMDAQKPHTVDDGPGLFSLFVKGGPAYVNENIAPLSRKIANGTLVRYHSLVLGGCGDYYEEGGIRYLREPPKFVVVSRDHETFPVKKKQFPRKNHQGHFQVEPGHAFTFHKVQGVTCEEGVVLDLNKRPPAAGHKLYHLSLQGVYVAMSRVRRLEDLRVMPWGFAGTDHLLQLAKRVKFPAMQWGHVLSSEIMYTWLLVRFDARG